MIDYNEFELNKEYRKRLLAKVEKQRLVDKANKGNRNFNPDALPVKAIVTIMLIVALFFVLATFSGQTYASTTVTPIETIHVVGDNQEGHSPKMDVQIAGWSLYADFEQLLLEMSANSELPLHDSRILTEPSTW